MCRIAGLISKSLESTELRYKVKAMCDSMKHGGPDDEGVFINEDGKVCLGHRRLSLIDLSAAGHQPMSVNDGQFVISFNGEIYNYQEIKAELIVLGYRFISQSDTEVILRAYEHWGPAAFKKLNGMFSFALYDKRKDTILLVRDVAGIKPLYYYFDNEKLVFASEVKAFRHAVPDIIENPDWKIYFLSFGFIPEPYTTLQGVRQLAPGTYLEYNCKTCGYSNVQFETLKFSHEITAPFEAQRLIREELQASVKRHLISDAPVGVFLSGGIDSSIVALLASQVHNAPIKTLSVVFDENKYSERSFQEIVNKKITGSHKYYHLTEKDYLEALPQIKSAFDQPSNDAINTWFITRCAKEEGLKAVLSGLGGDELFGGYPSFNRVELLKNMRHLPLRLFGLADHLSNDKLQKLTFLQQDSATADYLFLRGFYSPKTISQLIDATEQEVKEVLSELAHKTTRKDLQGKNYVSWMEQNIYMRSQLLKDTDYMSMAHGIEVRVPFLDKDFLKLVHRIDPTIKFTANKPKQLLIDAFSPILPKEIWDRKKMGFTFPFQEWNKKHPDIMQIADHPNQSVSKLGTNFLAGNLHWSRCIALLQILDFLPKKDTLFLTLKTFSQVGGIEKINRILMKAGNDLREEHLIRFKALSLYDELPDIKYIQAKRFKGFKGRLLPFIITAVKSGVKNNVVMLSHINLAVVGLLIKILSPKTKVLLQAHGIEIWGNLPFYKKYFLKKVDTILPVSRFTASQIKKKHNVASKQIRIFNNCLDPYFTPLSYRNSKINMFGDEFTSNPQILFTLTRISSSEKYKGYDHVIRAIAQLKDEFPNIRYILAGKYDEQEYLRIQSLIAEAGSEGYVRLVGFLPEEELTTYFNAADIFIMPSKKEGFGIVFIEAMACGLPVIAGNKDGSTDALKDGELGTLVNPDKLEEILTAIRHYLNNPITEDRKKRIIQNTDRFFSYQIYKKNLKQILFQNSYTREQTNFQLDYRASK